VEPVGIPASCSPVVSVDIKRCLLATDETPRAVNKYRSSLLSGRNVRWSRRMLPPGESQWVCRRDTQTDGRQTFPLRFLLVAANVVNDLFYVLTYCWLVCCQSTHVRLESDATVECISLFCRQVYISTRASVIRPRATPVAVLISRKPSFYTPACCRKVTHKYSSMHIETPYSTITRLCLYWEK